MHRFLFVVATFLTGATTAAALPLATGLTLCVGFTSVQMTATVPSSCELDGASTSIETAPFVVLTALATAPPGGAPFDAISSLTYYFEVVGGHTGDHVPLLIATTLETAAAPHSFAAALMNVTTTLGTSLTRACTDPASCAATGFDGTVSLMAVSGETDTVELTIQAANTAFFSGTASAFADPHIFVDPSFVGAGNYSIVVSPNVGNGLSSVPEPATLALLGVCLLGLPIARTRSGRVLTEIPASKL
jgi:hypothetical protein